MDGAGLSPLWAVPFAGLLLSLALAPMAVPRFWHRHDGKVVAAWGLAFIVPFAAVFGWHEAVHDLLHALLAEYIPFIVLLAALYVAAGGIFIHGNLRGSAGLNTLLLAIGAALASLVGTTGASMLMVRPLIRANDNRVHRVHVVVFFIFIVSNVGGSLTPLGDPPLFLGFLRGVDFFWTARNIFPETLFMVVALLAIFWFMDRRYFRRDGVLAVDPTPDTRRLAVEGGFNFALLAMVMALVLLSGTWKSPVVVDVLGVPIGLPSAVRDAGLVVVIVASLLLTREPVRQANQFSWAPMAEVAKLFAGIFLTIAPVIAMLKAGVDGPFGAIVRAVTRADGQPDPAMYFWATGILSSFLDNAPTYLVFFNTAGGDAATLMSTHAATLAAISAGAVFMGANTYIGNAPNLMVKAIAENRGIRMPGFFGYMMWSGAILVPLFVIQTFLFFR